MGVKVVTALRTLNLKLTKDVGFAALFEQTGLFLKAFACLLLHIVSLLLHTPILFSHRDLQALRTAAMLFVLVHWLACLC